MRRRHRLLKSSIILSTSKQSLPNGDNYMKDQIGSRHPVTAVRVIISTHIKSSMNCRIKVIGHDFEV